MSLELRRARNRQLVIFLLVCIGVLVMLGRLYYWQVVMGPDLAQQASAEHIQNQIMDAPRGLIYDTDGQVLATNVIRDDVYIEPIQFFSDYPDADKAQVELQRLTTALHQALPEVSVPTLMKAFRSGLPTVRVAAAIDPAQSHMLRRARLSYIFLEPRTLRTYPGGNLAAQLLGYVQDGHGVYGIEGQYNKLLSGRPGSFTAETDLNGNPLTVGESSMQPEISGADLKLTIDSTMQYLIQTALTETVKTVSAKGGTAIVVDAHTGAIVAMAGAPTFDPNHYSDYSGQKGCLNSLDVYFNPALYCGYEPGSTMKAVTMATALDQGLITPETTIEDPGVIHFKDAPPVTNWQFKGYGKESMVQVLEHSANVGAAYVAHDILGPDRFYPYLQRFGFGQVTGIDSLEIAGVYRTNTSPDWTPSDLTRQSFGQSILATPLQVAMAYQAMANGGVLMRPYLVASINNNGHVTVMGPQVQRRVISEHTAQLITDMLTQVVSNSAVSEMSIPGYKIAAKTGTATTQGLSDDQTEASVAGFFPASNPRFVILVKLDQPQATIYGSTAAGPLWKTIAQQLIWHYGIPPDQL